MALAAPKSALPATQQARRERVLAEAAAAAGVTELEVTPPVASDPPAGTEGSEAAPPLEQVSVSREEFQELQGARDRSNSLRVAAETARLEAEELRARLTELERTRKETPNAPATPELGFTEADTALSVEEQEEFGESEAFVRKIVRNEIAKALSKYDSSLTAKITGIEQAANTATTTIHRSNQKRFVDQVREKAADVDQLVQHANFKDFLEARVPMTNITYNTALNAAHGDEDLKAVLDIFNAFRTKYNITKPSKAGYAGANPSAAGAASESAASEAAEGGGKRYTLTERQKKSEDYRKGRISWDDLEAYKGEFTKAEADGRVDP